MKSEINSYETERLILKPTSIEDAEFILELMNSPKWLKYIGDRNLHTVEDATTYIIKKKLPQLLRLGYGNYTVIRKTDNIKLGTVGLYDREGLEGIDIGFAFLPAYEKKGYAFEAANKLKQLAFTVFGLTQLSGIISKENTASHQLLKKLGLTLTGTINIPNDTEELLLFKIKKKNY